MNIIGTIIKVTVAAAMIAGIVFLHGQNAELQTELARARFESDQDPQSISQTSMLRADYDILRGDIAFIEEYLVSRDAIVDIIAGIEEAAAGRGVDVNVSHIEERQDADTPGSRDTQEALIREVRVRISGSGDMDQLMQFLHHIGHSPYLVHLHSWRVGETRQAAQRGVTSGDAPEGTTRDRSVAGTMNADLIIFVKQ